MSLGIDGIRALETATSEQRAEMVRRLKAEPEVVPYFAEEVIDEIARRLRTMKPEALVNAVCDILSQSRLDGR